MGTSNNTVRLELALLSHLFTIAIKEWRVGLFYNPVTNIRKPSPGKSRDRRLNAEEEIVLFKACDQHSNPMLCWMAHIALYTGMRAGEIKSLTRAQVDLDKRTVHLTETKNGSTRSVPLTRQATDVFRAALRNSVRLDFIYRQLHLDSYLLCCWLRSNPAAHINATRRMYLWHFPCNDLIWRGANFPTSQWATYSCSSQHTSENVTP